MTVPLVILAVLSIVGGFIEWPHNLVHLALFSNLVQQVLPETVLGQGIPAEIMAQLIAVVATLSGVYLGYVLYYRNKALIEEWKQSPVIMELRNFLYKGWDFDALYQAVFVKPFVFLTQLNKADVVDKIYNGIAMGAQRLNQWFSVSQNGSLRWYVAGVLFGVLFILTLQILL